jgi:hypothetical protein
VTTGRAHQDAPVGLGVPVLPGLPGLVKALPVSPGSALPAVPQLPVQAPVTQPMSAPESAPLSGLTSQLPVVSGLTGTTPRHITTLPAKPHKPKKHGKPAKAGKPGKTVKKISTPNHATPVVKKKAIKKQHQALPIPLLAGMTDLPGTLPSQLPIGQLPIGQLPTGQLPTGQLPVRLNQADRSARRAADSAPALPGLQTLPVVGALPISGQVHAPEVGGVTDKLGQMRPMAAVQSVSGGLHGSAIYDLTVGALLGAASLVAAAARRIRRTSR